MSLNLSQLPLAHRLLIVFAIAAGLAIEVRMDLPGQIALSAVIWLVLFYVLAPIERQERHALLACLVIATAGELFLSLVWGLYTYRLGNVPLFVPAGHVMLLLLAIALAQQMSARFACGVLGCAAAYALVAAVTGLDTFALPLLAMLAVISLAMPQHRRLYASTFLLALALELYGTWLGSWTWERHVPAFELVTTNPPVLASAFYAVLDAIVACSALLLARRFGAPLARSAAREA
ncbi:MAG TPA: hypothetical protein VD867_14605 [Burkholderiales bacterium]|nr:hypothetical protein [Burkholderiales bacterium]